MNIFKEKGITHLDLHGIRHQDVKNEVLDFIYQYQSEIPLIIICGNSNRMIKIVEESLHETSIMFSMPRFGIIRIEKL
ncbi:hypothetical protein OAO53_01080 [Gammaproteobacteria bacterium]|jgi:hypothetical protein|nr:hypothetical protein [Gammaproteobacteria bacterium]MDC0420956.1 hypothetical protein [Gammaproteobacteria bacterium]MDC0536222.1 hypothetical protein [Gammaproteobacteria bacterium]MDC3244962.1 hypothetical protein [Gammaproteobacteria bacterium]|tara:strand:+ start:727 stop:960 length:234 start_codon:yes stop_codon:yes gene_type:complete